MRRPLPLTPGALLLAVLLGAACRRGEPAGVASVQVEAVLADPRDLPDERGEWLRLRNAGARPVALRGWTIASGGDRPHRIAADLVIAAGATALLGRSADGRGDGAGSATPAYVY